MAIRGGAAMTVKVTVAMVTYNQAQFVAQAIDSVLMQRTNFSFELLIADDGSTDGSAAIIEGYAAEHPERIRVLRSPQNRGKWGNFNYADALFGCRGEYAAFLDGDDYWTDQTKLQTQADLLDAHPDCSGVFHRVQLVDGAGSEIGLYPGADDARSFYSFADLVEGNAIAWSSAMYRLIRPLPAWPFELFCLDWAIHLLHAARGPVARIDRTMGAYRRHGGGVWSPLRRVEQLEELVAFTEQLPQHFPALDRGVVRRALMRHRLEIAMQHRAAGRFRAAVGATAAAIRSNPFSGTTWAGAARRWLGSFAAARHLETSRRRSA
jgi:hypothetical protein